MGKGLPRGLLRSLALPVIALVLALPACGGAEEEAPASPEIIPRETFVSAYVELRMAALRDTGGISTEERDTILRSHGITPSELVRFVDVYGEDPGALQEVWSDVQDRIREAREAAALERQESNAPSDPGPAQEPVSAGDTTSDGGTPDAGGAGPP